jgi:2-C-methyl-D-erythritol 4-phosphate cytidylyltransferase
MRMVAVVLGGGIGQRLGADRPKQLISLGGRTLIEHCVAAFSRAPGIDEVLVVMASGYVDQVKEMLAAELADGKVSAVIAGGIARSDSARIALEAVTAGVAGQDCGVLLHDAARPLVDQRIIADCVAALGSHDAVGTAVPTSDTIVVAKDRIMSHVPPREHLWRCQTPQCFRLPVIARAHALAAADPDFAPTDDCGVVLRYLPEVPVHIVAGSERNMKVTYPSDIAVAEALLSCGPAQGLAAGRLLHQGAAELPDQAAALARVLQHLVERLGERLHVAVVDHQRRDQLDDLHVVTGYLGEHPVPLEQRDDDHLREQADPCLLQHVPAGPGPQR